MLSGSDLHDALLLSYVSRRVGAETVHDHHRVHDHVMQVPLMALCGALQRALRRSRAARRAAPAQERALRARSGAESAGVKLECARCSACCMLPRAVLRRKKCEREGSVSRVLRVDVGVTECPRPSQTT